MRRYLGAGFALSDIYCDEFFRDADESQRRRRFARGATNDVGTAITALLGLANAGQDLVTGVATSFGLADNLWRNYEDAFVVSPDLSNVRSLVIAAQDNFRERTLGQNAPQPLPQDYGTAQSVILRYANLCSTLGMQALLNQSANQQRQQLNQETESQRTGQSGQSGQTGQTGQTGQNRRTGQPERTGQARREQTTPVTARPSSATPSVTSNSDRPTREH